MVDITARFRKHGGEALLEPGELLVAAVIASPSGSFAGDMGRLALGRATVRPKAAAIPDAADLASYLPATSVQLVLTDRRVAAFATAGAFRTKTGEHLVSFAREHLGALEHRGTATRIQCVLRFVDGSATAIEIERSKNTDAFVDALGRFLA